MATQKFSKGEAILFGWNTFKSNVGFFIVFLMLYLLLVYVPYVVALKVTEANIFLGSVLHIADMALTVLLALGFVKMSLRFCSNEKASFSDLFSQYRLFFKYLFSSILYALIVLAGSLLLVVPGVIWSIKYFFYDYFIVDKKAGPIEALKMSSAITKGVKWDLFVFFLMLVGINLLGALGLLVGLFVTLPTTIVATAYLYRRLLFAQSGNSTEPGLLSEKTAAG